MLKKNIKTFHMS